MCLKWVSLYCPKVRYFLKVDDDIFVNTFLLTSHLIEYDGLRSPEDQLSFICLVSINQTVIRDTTHKHYVPRESYKETVYPIYCSGAAYIITGPLVPLLYKNSFTTRYFQSEDVYVTGLLAADLNVTYNSIGHIYYLSPYEDVLRRQNAILSGKAVFAHMPGLDEEMKQLWASVIILWTGAKYNRTL